MKNKKISKKDLIDKVIQLEHKLGRRPTKWDNNSLYNYSRKLFGSWNNLMKEVGYDVRFYQKVGSTKLNEEFAYFLGLLLTDGSIYRNERLKQYKVAVYTSNSEEKDMLIRLIKSLFDYTPAVSPRMYGFNKRPNYEVRISSKCLAMEFIEGWNVPSGKKSAIMSVDDKINNSNNQIKSSFIRGVIDGDGSITSKGIKISSKSVRFLTDIKKILSDLNISSGSILKENKSGVFSVRINKKEDFGRIKEIYSKGMSYKRKKESIDKL